MSYTRTSYDRLYGETRRNGNQVTSWVIPLTNIRSGERVLGFKKKIALGNSAGSVFNIDSTKIIKRENGEIVLKYLDVNNKLTTETWVGLWPNSDVSHIALATTEVENEALMRIIRKIRKEQSQMNGLAFMGELREAIHGLRHPFESLRQKVYQHLTTLSKENVACSGTLLLSARKPGDRSFRIPGSRPRSASCL